MILVLFIQRSDLRIRNLNIGHRKGRPVIANAQEGQREGNDAADYSGDIGGGLPECHESTSIDSLQR